MRHIINFFWTWILISIFLIIVFYPVFLGLLILCMTIVPTTWAYSLIKGQSYHFTIDQSILLYRFNRIGQFLWIVTASVAIYWLVFHYRP
jgi:hypothetical protein